MGAYTMRCSLSLLVSAMTLAAPAAGLAQSPRHNVARLLARKKFGIER
jgi:hypothetical protein